MIVTYGLGCLYPSTFKAQSTSTCLGACRPSHPQVSILEVLEGEDVGEAELALVGGGVDLQEVGPRAAVVHAVVDTVAEVENLKRCSLDQVRF